MPDRRALAVLLLACACAGAADARTVYRCVRAGTVSLATAPEPKPSRCEPKQIPDDAAVVPNLWGNFGVFGGSLYEHQQPDGKRIYSTRALPGWTKVLDFTVATPPGEPAHPGLGTVGPPRLDRFAAEFRAAARATGVEDAWLRAIAHAESGFDPNAVSPKGAQGVMQLMPALARELGVRDPFSPRESIAAAARHLKTLMRRYRGDLTLVAAAYNAGTEAVARHRGVPPYRETQQYVEKVRVLHARYRRALGGEERPAGAIPRPALTAPDAR
ncbi:MAG TPA: lytic transglycosylase domain-containing protein [Lysobacter sp.]|nr:lytic transglycosylase domain-containing protein [Lysobacter sp.]